MDASIFRPPSLASLIDKPSASHDGSGENKSTAPSPSLSKPDHQWNEWFQQALEMPEDTPQRSHTKYQRLAQLSEDFVHLVKVYSKVILCELNEKEDAQRTIPRKSIGGVAGGLKYIVKGELEYKHLKKKKINYREFPSC